MTDPHPRHEDSLAEHVRTHSAEPLPGHDEVPAAPARADGPAVAPEDAAHPGVASVTQAPAEPVSGQADPQPADGSAERPWTQPPPGEKRVLTKHGHLAREKSGGLWVLDDGTNQPVEVGLGFLVHAHGPFTKAPPPPRN